MEKLRSGPGGEVRGEGEGTMVQRDQIRMGSDGLDIVQKANMDGNDPKPRVLSEVFRGFDARNRENVAPADIRQ